MPKFLLHIFRFGLFAAVGFFALSSWAVHNRQLQKTFFSAPTNLGATYLRMPDLKRWAETQSDKKKVLFIGPSTLYRGVDPAVLENENQTAFNAGSSGQRLLNSYFLLRQAETWGGVDKVVLDVFPRFWGSGSGVESARDLIVNNPEFPSGMIWEMALASQDVHNLFLATYYSIKRGVFGQDSLHLEMPPEDQYRGNGFVYSLPREGKELDIPQQPREMSTSDWYWYKRIRSYCIKNDIELLLLLPPEVQPTPCILPFGEDALLINAREAGLADSLFYDNHHLLGPGAEAFSRWLLGEI